MWGETVLFGYAIDPNFDIAKEQRRSRLIWVLIGGLTASLAYLFLGLPLPTQVFQAILATGLFYGATFYVDRRPLLNRAWMWGLIIATIPVHLLYMAVVFWLDVRFPEIMTKAITFVPLLAVGFAVESVYVGGIIDQLTEKIQGTHRTVS